MTFGLFFFAYLVGPSQSLRKPLEDFILPYDDESLEVVQEKKNLGKLIVATYQALLRKNQTLLNINNIHLQHLLNINWNDLVPLEREDLNQVIESLQKKEVNVSLVDYYLLLDSQWFLSDFSLLKLYPMTPLRLVFRKLASSPEVCKSILAEEVDRFVKGNLYHLRDYPELSH